MNVLVESRRVPGLALCALMAAAGLINSAPAAAADTKTVSGAVCQPDNGSVLSDFRYGGGGVMNIAPGDRFVVCALTIDSESLNQVDVKVFLNTPLQATAQCVLESLRIDTDAGRSYGVQLASSPTLYLRRSFVGGIGGIRYQFSGIYAGLEKPVVVKCRLGYNGQLSYIQYTEL